MEDFNHIWFSNPTNDEQLQPIYNEISIELGMKDDSLFLYVDFLTGFRFMIIILVK